MAKSQLRVYYGPTDSNGSSLVPEIENKNEVTLSVGDIVPLLADALRDQRTWLRDFRDDEITISTDLTNNQLRIFFKQRLATESYFFNRAGGQVLDKDIGPSKYAV